MTLTLLNLVVFDIKKSPLCKGIQTLLVVVSTLRESYQSTNVFFVFKCLFSLSTIQEHSVLESHHKKHLGHNPSLKQLLD